MPNFLLFKVDGYPCYPIAYRSREKPLCLQIDKTTNGSRVELTTIGSSVQAKSLVRDRPAKTQ